MLRRKMEQRLDQGADFSRKRPDGGSRGVFGFQDAAARGREARR
jgi:hypothetical protein